MKCALAGAWLAGCLAVLGCAPAAPPAAKAPAPASTPAEQPAAQFPEKLTAQHLPNPVRVHEQVISGGLPEGDDAFAELQAMGVKTIISVDGAKPDVAAAKRYGLRYVHLPHGYDGIPDQRALELAKAVQELPGPVYIHCHHGKHRSPAAAAVACVGAGLIAPEDTRNILEFAGTSPNYRGLYQSAAEIKPFDGDALKQLKAAFPETVQPSPLAEAMVALEHTHDHVKQLADNQWQPIAAKPDLDAPHEALLLREHYTEMLRTEEVMSQPGMFQEWMKQGEADAKELEELLAAWEKAGRPREVPATAVLALQRVTNNCKACHVKYRDVPLKEKQASEAK